MTSKMALSQTAHALHTRRSTEGIEMSKQNIRRHPNILKLV